MRLYEIGIGSATYEAVTDPWFPYVLGLFILLGVFSISWTYHAEQTVSRIAESDIETVGHRCLQYAVVPAALTLTLGSITTVSVCSLRNVWDLGIIWVVVGIQYIGLWLYLYYGPPLKLWQFLSPELEVKHLEMVRDDQKMLLRAFVAVTFALLIGQAFAILKIKYEEILKATAIGQKQGPLALVNAIQVAYLLLGWWSLVFARCLKRTEEVRLRMQHIELPDSKRELL